MSQNIGLQEGRKGRRMIQPPGGSSNLFLSDRIASPDARMRSHRIHHEHMKSSIFDGEDYKDPEKRTQSRTSGENRLHTPAFSPPPQYPRHADEHLAGGQSTQSPQNASNPIEDGDTRRGDAVMSSASQLSNRNLYRKQTEESRDSVFSDHSSLDDSTWNRNRRPLDLPTSESDQGARGVAFLNRLTQAHRGFNVLTGQSSHEAENSRKSDHAAYSYQKERDMAKSPQERPAAGFVAGGRINKYVRGQPFDSGPLW